MSTFRLIFWIFLALGIGFLGVAVVALQLQLGRGGQEKATATVVRLETTTSSSSSGGVRRTLYCPVIAFTTGRGQRVEIESQACASPPAYEVGETMAVEYDPADPANAAYGGFFTRWLITLVFAIVGAVFFGLSVLFGVLDRRRRGVS